MEWLNDTLEFYKQYMWQINYNLLLLTGIVVGAYKLHKLNQFLKHSKNTQEYDSIRYNEINRLTRLAIETSDTKYIDQAEIVLNMNNQDLDKMTLEKKVSTEK